MKFIKLEKVLVVFISLIIGFIATYHWFSEGTFLYYWDTLYPLDTKFSIQTFFYNWNPLNFPGYAGNGWSWLPYSFSIAALNFIFNDPSIVQRILYISFIVLSLFSFYLFSIYLLEIVIGVKNEFKYKFISFLFAILYTFNLYTFYYSYFMFNPQIYIYSLLPLNFLALFKIYPLVIKAKSYVSRVWVFIFFLTLLFMSPGFTTYLFLQQYLVILFFYLSFHWLLSRSKILSYKTLSLLIFLFLIIIINWWWFFPSLLGFKDLYESQSSLGTTIYFDISSINSNLLNSLRLLGSPMMNNNPFSWGSIIYSQFFSFPMLIFLFLIIFLLVKIKNTTNKNNVYFFLSFFIVLLFIVKLGNPPMAWLTKFAFEHVPFFGAFRDAWHKAGLYYVFSYFVLSFIGFSLLTKLTFKKEYKKISYLSFVLLILASIVVTSPFFLFAYDNIKTIGFSYANKRYTFSAKTKIPPEYKELKSYISDKCAKSPILVVPRSSMISSAIWEKYKTSYVGQDMLTRFINCGFISGQMLKNGPDSFTFAPYILLAENDFITFKKYLIQNQISYVLVRKDSVPFYYTNYINLSKANPAIATKQIDSDSDFTKVFQNDYFSLYKIDLGDEPNFGFSMPSTITYTNLNLDNGYDYAILSRLTPFTQGTAIIKKNEDLKKFQDKINYYSVIANCVGCVEISDVPIDISSESFSSNLKTFVKKLIGRDKNKNIKPDEKISLEIVSANKLFGKLSLSLIEGNAKDFERYLNEYTNSFRTINTLLIEYEVDFFTKNNKYIEYESFFKTHIGKLSKYIGDKNINKKGENIIKNSSLRGKLIYLLALENDQLRKIRNNIWKTDFDKNLLRLRLDIPYSGNYSCFAKNSNSGINIQGIYKDLRNEQGENIMKNGSVMNLGLSRGNYPVTIKYEESQIYENPSLKQGKADLTEIPLGKLDNGVYSINFTIEKNKDMDFAILVSEGRLDENDFLASNDENIIYSVLDSARTLNGNLYQRKLSINDFETKEYYLYFFTIDTYLEPNVEYKNIVVKREIDKDDIKFYCSLDRDDNELIISDNIKVERKSPVKYQINLLKNTTGKFLTFNQTFNKDWEAYAIIEGKKHTFYHFENAYSNGWYLDKDVNGTITVEFTRQKLIIVNGIATLILFLGLFGCYLIMEKKNGKSK